MIVEIVSVGTELLMGQVVNSDAQFIASRIAPLGCQVFYHSTVGDNRERLTAVAKQALSRSDVVIFTGGLGPTDDDLTKETVAEAMGLVCEPNEAEIEKLKLHFANRGREMTPNNIKQACFPKGAIILENRNGTAPGCILEADGKAAILLPGPPRELNPMVDASVLPYLEERSGFLLHSREVRIFGLGESDATYRLRHLIENQTNPTVAPYIKPGEVTLRITAKCKTRSEGEALIAPMLQSIQETLGDYVYSLEGQSLPQVVSQALRERNETLAVAESLTGGLLASLLVDLPGCSEILSQGIVAYSNEAKMARLGVREETLSQYGAVSAPCAWEMAEGLLRSSGADYALATTGFAGPEGDQVGLVYVALAGKGNTDVKELHLGGDRSRIRLLSAYHALDMLRRKLCT